MDGITRHPIYFDYTLSTMFPCIYLAPGTDPLCFCRAVRLALACLMAITMPPTPRYQANAIGKSITGVALTSPAMHSRCITLISFFPDKLLKKILRPGRVMPGYINWVQYLQRNINIEGLGATSALMLICGQWY